MVNPFDGGKITVIRSLEDIFDSADNLLLLASSIYAIRNEVPDDPSDSMPGAFYRLTSAKPNYPTGAVRGILINALDGGRYLLCNEGLFEYANGAWESISSGGGGTDLGPINAAINALESEQLLQENDITTLQEQNATRIQEIGALDSNDAIQDEEIANIETEQTTQNQRISALEQSGRGALSPALSDFDRGLEEVAGAGTRTYTAGFDSVVEFRSESTCNCPIQATLAVFSRLQLSM